MKLFSLGPYYKPTLTYLPVVVRPRVSWTQTLMQIHPKTILPSPLQMQDTCTYEPNKIFWVLLQLNLQFVPENKQNINKMSLIRDQDCSHRCLHMRLPGNTKPDGQSCHECLINLSKLNWRSNTCGGGCHQLLWTRLMSERAYFIPLAHMPSRPLS